MFQDDSSDFEWVCSLEDPNLKNEFSGFEMRLIVSVGDEDFLEYLKNWEQDNNRIVESGKMVMVLEEADVFRDHIEIDTNKIKGLVEYDDSQASSEILERRSLAASTGIHTTLVLRVSLQDKAPPSAVNLSEDIFGDQYCLKSQMSRCSYGKLEIKEYRQGDRCNVPTATNAPGVVDISVPWNTFNHNKDDVEDEVIRIAKEEIFGTSSLRNCADLVMICMPPGLGSFVAYAYLGHYISVYNNHWCQSLSAQMHEVGHSISLHHSGQYGGGSSEQEYGDKQGYMGYSYNQDDTPAMCYNAAKNYQLGWYEGKEGEIDPYTDLCTGPTRFMLNGVVDYQNGSPGAYVTLKVGGFWYLGFNKASGFNVGTQEAKNQVTIHKKEGSVTSASKSKIEADLSVAQSYALEISSDLDLLVVYVELENGKDAVVELSVSGSAAMACPSEAPTDAPTDEPTDNPTDKPTDELTDAPVEPPSNAPVEPTNAPVDPTNAPVEPTNAPVEPPTNAPVEPTNAPVNPTNAPVEPTNAPVQPTNAPVDPPSYRCVDRGLPRAWNGGGRFNCAFYKKRKSRQMCKHNFLFCHKILSSH